MWLIFACSMQENIFSSYLNHLIFPVCHSYRSPTPRRISKVLTTFTVVVDGGSIGNGISTAISISKIRNNTATTKNCIEKGIRIVELLRNPHSNALFIDFSVFLLFAIVFAITARAAIMARLTNCIKVNFNMFYFCGRLEVGCKFLLYG